MSFFFKNKQRRYKNTLKNITKNNPSADFVGKLGEIVVIIYYKLMFYKIVGHRVRNFCGEIDIIAKRFNTIVFIEVKSRINPNTQYHVISQYQIKRITNAANIFLNQNHKLYSKHNVRFDLAIVSKLFFPKIISNAWINDWDFY